jgi:hypothetical protein
MRRSSSFRVAVPALALSLTLATTAGAQAPSVSIQPSGRATTTIEIVQRVPQGTPAAQRPAPKRVSIDYGQPHLRGRDVAPLVPTTGVWRLGANTSTTLTTEVDLVFGGTTVPAGTYSLYLFRTANGAQLAINKQTGQWGTEYNQANDLARVPMKVTTLHQALDALQISLVPAQGAPKGTLRVVWGTLQMEADFDVKL